MAKQINFFFDGFMGTIDLEAKRLRWATLDCQLDAKLSPELRAHIEGVIYQHRIMQAARA